MANLIKTDKFNRPIYDVTDELRSMKLAVFDGNIVKAERRGLNILILQRRPGGHWLINWWWTDHSDAALNDVQGTETARFSRKEIDFNRCLFEQVNLF